MAGFGNSRNEARAGNIKFVVGLLLGVIIGFAGPRAVRVLRRQPPPAVALPAPAVRPAASGTIVQILAQPQERGIMLAATSPLKLLKTSDSKLAKQQGGRVFSGFRSWSMTSGYLNSGTGEFILKSGSDDPVETGWKATDYKDFVGGAPLQVRIATGQQYVLYFKRQGRSAINLGTFIIGNAGSGVKIVPTKAPAATGKLKP